VNRAFAALVAALGVSGCASTAERPPVGAAPSSGYLEATRLANLAETIPSPPTAGSAADIADKATSDRYRALQGGDRWLLATAHAELRPAFGLPHFDCVLGTRLASTPTPRLTALFDKVLHDANDAAERVKTRAFRARPVADDPSRTPCQRVTEAQRRTPSYPSGSAAVGAAYGEVLAALAPDRAAETRRIGHEIALSRVVCGMHYSTDAEVGEDLGIAVAKAIVASPAFQADRAEARAELDAARSAGLTNPACAAERSALAAPLP